MKRIISVCLALCMSLAAFCLPAGAEQKKESEHFFFVSPTGSDRNMGTFDAPFATFAGVKNYLKNRKNELKGKTTVYFREGTYIFDETVAFDGNDMPDVTYKAYRNETVIFSGAHPVTGFTETEINGVRAFTTQTDCGIFKSLFNGEEQLSQTRYPETGYFKLNQLNPEDNIWTQDNAPWPLTLGERSFTPSKSDVPHAFHNMEDVTVRILHYWHDEMATVADYNEETGKITLSRPSCMLMHTYDRFFFENVLEALNEPGEWYLDSKTGQLWYVPQDGETADSLTLYASSLEQLITVDGCSGLHFENIRFMNTDWTIPTSARSALWSDWLVENDIDAPQAAYDVVGVIQVCNASDIVFRNCEWHNIGVGGVKMTDGVTNSVIENCLFDNIAATAVFVGGQNVEKGEPGSTYDITVHNNHIVRYGRKFYCAIGVQFTYVAGGTISNNEIHDGYYTAISVGWMWGYAFHATRDIHVTDNLIYDIGQGWLSDMGGIYTLGLQPGSVLSGNVIHNVAADAGEGGYGGWGIYNDEGSSYLTIENNLVFCCGSQGFFIHYAGDNVIRNNISAFNGKGQAGVGSRYEADKKTADYRNNIYLTDSHAPIYTSMEQKGHFSDDNCIMWDVTYEDDLRFTLGNYGDVWRTDKTKRKGFLGENSVIADPGFVDAEHFDFTLTEDSLAVQQGFEPWDYTKAGTVAGTVIGVSQEGGTTAVTQNAHRVETESANAFGDKLTGKISSVFAVIISIFLSVLHLDGMC